MVTPDQDLEGATRRIAPDPTRAEVIEPHRLKGATSRGFLERWAACRAQRRWPPGTERVERLACYQIRVARNGPPGRP